MEILTKNQRSVKAVQKWRKSIKERMISCMGGCCQICGYNKSNSALEFHHIDPNEKDFTFGKVMANPRSAKLLKEELKKCIMLCSNCHREVHENIACLPADYSKLDENMFDEMTKRHKVVKPIKCIDRRKIKLTNDEILTILEEEYNGNKSQMAKTLGVSEAAIRKRLKEFEHEKG